MTSEDNMEARRARVRIALDAAGVDPTDDMLAAAPHLDLWAVFEDPLGFTLLMGRVTGHPRLRGPAIRTSPLLRIDPTAGWARTFSRFYRLGAPLSDAGPVTEKAILAAAGLRGYCEMPPDGWIEAMRRNHDRILAFPGLFL